MPLHQGCSSVLRGRREGVARVPGARKAFEEAAHDTPRCHHWRENSVHPRGRDFWFLEAVRAQGFSRGFRGVQLGRRAKEPQQWGGGQPETRQQVVLQPRGWASGSTSPGRCPQGGPSVPRGVRHSAKARELLPVCKTGWTRPWEGSSLLSSRVVMEHGQLWAEPPASTTPGGPPPPSCGR